MDSCSLALRILASPSWHVGSQVIEVNPIIEYLRYIIFPWFNSFEVRWAGYDSVLGTWESLTPVFHGPCRSVAMRRTEGTRCTAAPQSWRRTLHQGRFTQVRLWGLFTSALDRNSYL